ncbi:MAG: toll/interleukin-1 receptor domain-containing protein, partial [Anaerolineales bacterium]|nr:toll/interleukin-1 receptor domain-containing protein [Anaerolineales bacterium]
MTKNIFMSYSRRELGFVDDLVHKLEGENYNVWLDYRALIPGNPWNVQIEKGLKEADTVLLVVSKASLSSKYVTLEWQHFLETKKRVILLVFEAVD